MGMEGLITRLINELQPSSHLLPEGGKMENQANHAVIINSRKDTMAAQCFFLFNSERKMENAHTEAHTTPKRTKKEYKIVKTLNRFETLEMAMAT